MRRRPHKQPLERHTKEFIEYQLVAANKYQFFIFRKIIAAKMAGVRKYNSDEASCSQIYFCEIVNLNSHSHQAIYFSSRRIVRELNIE